MTRGTKLKGSLQWLFNPGPLLSQRLLHAVSWAVVGRASLQLLSLSRAIVLAKLLSPYDFGVMGAATAAWFLLERPTRAGLWAALVQKKGDINTYLDTAWSINVLRGFLLFGILLVGAPYVAAFLQASNAVSILRFVALVLFLRHLVNPGVVYFQKELEFGKQFRLEICRAVLEMTVTITLAVVLRSVWALAIGLLAGEITGLVVSYLIHPYRPRPRFEWDRAREIYRFGRWVSLGNVFDTVAAQVDKIVIARVLGVSSLGVYQIASRLSYALLGQISYGLNGIGFPAFARMQDEAHRLRFAYLYATEAVATLALPFGVVAFFLAGDFVSQVLGDQWLPAVPVIKALAAAACFQPLNAPLKALLYGVGRPGASFWIDSVGNVALIASVYPLTMHLGVTGAAVAILLASLSKVPLQFGYCVVSLRVPPGRMLLALLPGAAISGVLATMLLVVRSGLKPLGLADLVLVAGLTIPLYLGSVMALWILFKAGPLRSLALLRSSKVAM